MTTRRVRVTESMRRVDDISNVTDARDRATAARMAVLMRAHGETGKFTRGPRVEPVSGGCFVVSADLQCLNFNVGSLFDQVAMHAPVVRHLLSFTVEAKRTHNNDGWYLNIRARFFLHRSARTALDYRMRTFPLGTRLIAEPKREGCLKRLAADDMAVIHAVHTAMLLSEEVPPAMTAKATIPPGNNTYRLTYRDVRVLTMPMRNALVSAYGSLILKWRILLPQNSKGRPTVCIDLNSVRNPLLAYAVMPRDASSRSAGGASASTDSSDDMSVGLD